MTEIIIKDVRPPLSASLAATLTRPSLRLVFKNLDDPSDKSFEPESYPVMDLEFPNNHASERYVGFFWGEPRCL